MERAGLLGDPPPLQNYPNWCLPSRLPLFGAPWQCHAEMQLSRFQYNQPPILPFGMQSLTTEKKRRRRRNRQRTSWIGDDGYRKNLGIQIKFGNNCQPTINIKVDTQQQANIFLKTNENRNRGHSQRNSRQNIRRQRQTPSINLSLEAQIPNSPKFNGALLRQNRSLEQKFKRTNDAVRRRSRRGGFSFKQGISPLLRDEGLNMPRQPNRIRNFRSRRKNFRNWQNRGEIGHQNRGIQDPVVTEMAEKELELVDEEVETDANDLDLEDLNHAYSFCSDEVLESQVPANNEEICQATTNQGDGDISNGQLHSSSDGI